MVQRVLAVAVFVGFWVVIALGLLMLASRGGPSGAAKPRRLGRGSNGAVGVMFVVTVVVFGVALPVLVLTGNHSNASAQVGGVKLTTAQKTGRILFGEHCGFCHTLAAANAVGKVGPNLDVLQPPQSLVLHTINYGCLQNAPNNDPQTCLGYGTMPAALVQGQDATDVANFVARVAGK